jgi:hypothetical protein
MTTKAAGLIFAGLILVAGALVSAPYLNARGNRYQLQHPEGAHLLFEPSTGNVWRIDNSGKWIRVASFDN